MKQQGQVEEFDAIRIGLASPAKIRSWSFGEVKKPETINYRTFKPERDGLFCAKIFGPIKDYECLCGKYKRLKHRGVICEKCGVEVTLAKVRRDRMGHIELASPVAHIWFLRSLPSRMGLLLDMTLRDIERVLYFEAFVVIDPGMTRLERGQLLSDETYLEAIEEYGDEFDARMGAEAIFQLLHTMNLKVEVAKLREDIPGTTSETKSKKLTKRLKLMEAFLESGNNPEWMVMTVLPVLPPELRPLVPLDGGRFATSDLNDLYRRVINRNNRLKRLLDLSAPDIIVRNEKRMLQESVDALLDNGRRGKAITGSNKRPLKSLADMIKGKQGRFRQNLLGKRVDYSGRSVIVVGPTLRLHQCGLPKKMALELFKPFIFSKLERRGLATTIKAAKKLVEREGPEVWDILEEVIREHPVLLNRAPTLHRLGIQSFEPVLIEGKAIQLHPLVCTAFNADFDGDQMAVHVPLGHHAIMEASILMLSSHNIMSPANGSPIAVPSQDMVLGLYYLTKDRPSTPEDPVPGENMRFYGPEEVIIALNERRISKNAKIFVKVKVRNEKEELEDQVVETVAGRVVFNQYVPEEVGYVNELLTKKKLRDIIAMVFKYTDVARTAHFLDDIKQLGFQTAYKGGLSIGLGDVVVPPEKDELINQAKVDVEGVTSNYQMGLITDNERYNQVIDIWTKINSEITRILMKQLDEDQKGFNPIYMMMHSGARGSREQIRQLGGMRGLMAKPQKNLQGSVGEIIENPIISNFKEGLDVIEYFISTHGARKGLADTALKTADAGYLTRRLVDVAQDVIITEADCGTLRGITITALKDNEEIVEPLSERVLGRVTVHDVIDPITDEVILESGEEITELLALKIDTTSIESVEIRSVLTCETRHGVCAKCYGRNLATAKMVQKGESVGVIAAQSIGEPGTQLTLRTFHVGGVAVNIASEATISAKFDGVIQFEDLRTVSGEDSEGNPVRIVMGRSGEVKIVSEDGKKVLISNNIPYGSYLRVNEGDKVKKKDLICEWDPFNAVILSEIDGKVEFESIVEGITYKEEADEQTGFREKIIIDTKDKTKNPAIIVNTGNEETMKSYNLPVGAHIAVKEGKKIKAGQILAKIPRTTGKTRDITGGLPRVTELFEARNPSNPAVVSAIDGVVTYGGIKRGNREIFIESKDGVKKRYLVSLSKHILVQDNDFVKAGQPLSDGAITPSDILSIKGPTAVQEYLVNEIQEVYRLQGVKINDKHIEVIVRQMMQKVEIIEPGDTNFLPGQVVDKFAFREENDSIINKKVVVSAGDSKKFKPGQIVTARALRDENSTLKRKDLKIVKVRDAEPAVSRPTLQGITQASLGTDSFISAASFQETTKVLSEAAINGKTDFLLGLKENVIVGHLIPAGTGLREYEDLIVYSEEEYDRLQDDGKPQEYKEKQLQK
ncbi:MAG: DNA-directed RNA polymerase subunit beta' [Microscillaceae bacterium]|nr:DNA-directed RNA polymerase subunit beta' [Microscillaceae bacterium]